MKYFTKEWYDEMQVAGFLAFPETIAEWEEVQSGYRKQGLDPAEIHRRDLEGSREDLLRFLPEAFHPYIYDGTINSEFPSTELRKLAAEWEAAHEARVDSLLDDYSRHYEAIKEFLPPGLLQLTEKSLHDCVVRKVDRSATDELVLCLDCSGGFHYFKDIQVTFIGVEQAVLPEYLDGAWWLYNEIYLDNDLFELHVLVNEPMTELVIVCQDVHIEELD